MLIILSYWNTKFDETVYDVLLVFIRLKTGTPLPHMIPHYTLYLSKLFCTIALCPTKRIKIDPQIIKISANQHKKSRETDKLNPEKIDLVYKSIESLLAGNII